MDKKDISVCIVCLFIISSIIKYSEGLIIDCRQGYEGTYIITVQQNTDIFEFSSRRELDIGRKCKLLWSEKFYEGCFEIRDIIFVGYVD